MPTTVKLVDPKVRLWTVWDGESKSRLGVPGDQKTFDKVPEYYLKKGRFVIVDEPEPVQEFIANPASEGGKDALRDEYEALSGVKPDGRWSVDRLRDGIAQLTASDE